MFAPIRQVVGPVVRKWVLL